ncbi:MAG: D-alanine--D-alanine ligase [Candidatus Synoicihabitans palmerolidicus]|nr:D-alanine--D-alanine ligase [Candidatus Synoicihabitans palmerolidicus]
MSEGKFGINMVVLVGGTSSEREVSLGSGKACAVALTRHFPTRMVDVVTEVLPEGLNPNQDVVFSTLHGTFGEDGGMQTLLEDAGVFYAGCDAFASALTFDKERTKSVVSASGVKVVPGKRFQRDDKPTVEELVATLGPALVFKQNRGGSSVGLALCGDVESSAEKLRAIESGEWLVERWVRGREVTVGVLHGRALPVVEISPMSGIFDYESKYTKGKTEYLASAPLQEDVAREVQIAAETAFAACGCRDYARIDFMITAENAVFLLEINTLPGMKETSLLPIGAGCVGIDFTALVRELVNPAIFRFSNRSPETSKP